MRIRHFDKNGNEIKDLSKVKLPEEIQIELIKVLKGEPKREGDKRVRSMSKV